MTKYIDKTKYKNNNKSVEGFAMLDSTGTVAFTEMELTEEEMLARYNPVIEGCKIVRIRVEILEKLSPV